ncbi:hypothetical protein AAG906_021008 [Vitis piasezkii]
MFTEQANALGTYNQYSSNSPYSNTYNPSWRNHPNLSWRGGNNGQFQQQGNRFLGMPSQNFQQQHQTSSSNSSTEDMMREFILKQDKCNEDQNRINAQTSQELVDIRTTLSQLVLNCNVVITLEMGKNTKSPSYFPAYAKFLKDLCTMKRRIKLSKKAFLTEQVSAIIENKAMVKYKDPDSFVERVLLDLGASVNLLPYSIYKQLGLGELKAITITLSLADCSIKVPRGVVEDVLVQVEKFYYPVEFVVLDTEPLKKGMNYVPIILGRPFLATTNALINCRNGLMQLSFGNMTVEMNVFNLCKQPMDHDDVENEEACLIEALVQEHTEKLMEENIDEFFSTIVKEECVQVATEWKEKYTIQYLNKIENDEESKRKRLRLANQS